MSVIIEFHEKVVGQIVLFLDDRLRLIVSEVQLVGQGKQLGFGSLWRLLGGIRVLKLGFV